MIKIQGIVEYRDEQNLAYILPSAGLFYQTAYKVMQNQERYGFIKCARIIHNGKDKLIYDISNYKTLSSLLSTLHASDYFLLIQKLLERMVKIEEIGYMQSENIDVSFDNIFVNSSDEVYMIHLPIQSEYMKNRGLSVEKILEENIIGTINQYQNLQSDELFWLCNVFKTSKTDLKSIRRDMELRKSGGLGNESECKRDELIQMQEENQTLSSSEIKGKKGFFKKIFSREKENEIQMLSQQIVAENDKEKVEEGEQAFQIAFVGLKKGSKIKIVITNQEFIIGKKAGEVDGVLECNNLISRKHCKVIYSNKSYFIKDLGSANGTYVNNIKIEGNQRVPIKPGDKIRLANMDFIVKIIK